jgi:hypothetical protein
MFVRRKTVRSNGRTYQYLQIVENHWVDGKARQRIIGNLGRLDALQQNGDLERLITQLVEECPTVRLLRAQSAGTLQVVSDQVWGPVLIFERLWDEQLGLRALLRSFAKGRKLGFDLERAVFAITLQRLLAPGSDLAGSKWIRTVRAEGFDTLELRHFYRALGLLWRRKDQIERALYARHLDLFNRELDLVFFDTTSTYFEGRVWEGWAKLGKSKDHRPDHIQLVLSVVMRRDGVPVCCEIWPGNTADVKTVVPTIEALKKRFQIKKVVFVADRGMVSAANLAAIEKAGYEYIIGAKLRNNVEVRDNVLARAGRYAEVSENLRVKEVTVDDRRYVVCFNPEEAKKDRHDREAVLEKLRSKLAGGRGVKALINNRGYKRFLAVKPGAVQIDLKRVTADARYDGKYVLRTTTKLPSAEVAEAYRHLTWIERLWRDLKSTMEVRPIYHHIKKDNVKGHIFACFLALHLAAALKQRLAQKQVEAQWDEVIRDLSSLRAVDVMLDDKVYRLRSPIDGCAGQVFAAVGMKAPALAEPLTGS